MNKIQSMRWGTLIKILALMGIAIGVVAVSAYLLVNDERRPQSNLVLAATGNNANAAENNFTRAAGPIPMRFPEDLRKIGTRDSHPHL